MYIIKYSGQRNTCEIWKLEDCQTWSSSFSKKKIEKFYRKNHIIINYSEAVRRDNISQVTYCKGVKRRTDNSDDVLTLSALICWNSISSFNLTYFQNWPIHFIKTSLLQLEKLPLPLPQFFKVWKEVGFFELCTGSRMGRGSTHEPGPGTISQFTLPWTQRGWQRAPAGQALCQWA